jgi:ribosomal subunit interface protein
MMVAEHVTVSGRNMEIGEALPIHVESQMDALSQKYFGRLVTCRIVFTKLPKGVQFKCHIQVVVGHDLHYVSEADATEVHICFSRALNKLAAQLRREKNMLHDGKPGSSKTALLDEMLKPEIEKS